jgi:hypothetical protein
MKCRRAKTLIFDFIDGMIGDQDRVALETHLTECTSCESMAASLSKSLDLLHSVPQVQPSDNFNWKVRLGITHARNAAVTDIATERAWLRSWNVRFAFSAISTFVVVATTGYFLTRSSIVPGGDRVVSDPVSVAETVAAKHGVENPPAPKKAGGTTFYDNMASPGSPIVTERVATGNGSSAGSTSPLIGDVPLNIDSLTSHFLRSRVHEVHSQYRMQRLEEQIKALQGELSECEKQDE